jgi:hypothetical protein
MKKIEVGDLIRCIECHLFFGSGDLSIVVERSPHTFIIHHQKKNKAFHSFPGYWELVR